MSGTSAAQRQRRPLRHDIQALRTLAVLLVFADHLFGWPSGGFLGVDVFFVISGYLITGVLLREGARDGTISLREFYARRVRRIVPVAALVLLVTYLSSRAVLSALRAEQAAADSWWALLFGANIHFDRLGTDYFEQNRPPSPVQHYWSLSVEEQFYVLWPLLLLLVLLVARARRWSAAQVALPVAAAVVLASYAYCLSLSSSDPTGAYFSTAARAWELGVGALAALLQGRASRLPEAARAGLAWAGLAGVLLSALVVDATTVWPGAATLLPVLATAALLCADDPQRGPSRAGLGHNVPVQYVGLLSYSLYLWHWPVIVLAEAHLDDRGVAFHLVAGLLPFALSGLTYHGVERPIHASRWLSRRTAARRAPAEWARSHRRRLVAGTAALATLLCVPGLAALGTEDDPAPPGAAAAPRPGATANAIATALAATRWPALEPALEDLPGAGAPEWFQDDCLDVEADDIARCTYGDARGPRTAVLLGDSVSASYLPAIRSALPSGWRIVTLTRRACPFVDLRTVVQSGVPYDACYRHRAFEVAQVKALRPDLVIVSGQATTFAGRILGRPRDPLANVREWQAGLRRLLLQVSPMTSRLVVLAGPPGGANLQECAATRVVDPAECVAPLSKTWTALSAAEARATAAAGGSYVSTASWFCSGGSCPAVIGSTPVYIDGRHLTRRFSESLAGKVGTHLRGR